MSFFFLSQTPPHSQVVQRVWIVVQHIKRSIKINLEMLLLKKNYRQYQNESNQEMAHLQTKVYLWNHEEGTEYTN